MSTMQYISYNKSLDHISKYILSAEGEWENNLGKSRFFIEKVQDFIANTSPLLARKLDFSVGSFNIKPSTARNAVNWAKYKKKVKVIKNEEEIVPAIMSTRKSKNIVKTILLMLKESHPQLKQLSWKQIERNKRFIMKLYSGYMGAGGDWNRWRRTIQPGKIAQTRMMFL